MRVLTFNVWSDARTWQRRLPAIYDTLRDMEFDLVALQEVPVDDEGGPGVAQRIAEQAGYPYAEFRPYAPGEKDGLAVLSRTRLDDVKSGRDSGREGLEECALRVTTQIQGQALVLTNVHLDAGGIDRREQEILALNSWIEGHPSSGLDLLCGDFNCSPASSVYRFLTGEQTLANQSSGRIIKRSGGPWQDAVALNHGIRGGDSGPTLDFLNNPRWRYEVVTEVPRRVDWILFKLPTRSTVSVEDAGRCGIEPSRAARVVPSDHYGVWMNLAVHEPPPGTELAPR